MPSSSLWGPGPLVLLLLQSGVMAQLQHDMNADSERTIANKPTQPHVVMLVADDLGWHDIGYRAGTDVRTPHLDKLAAAGIKLDSYYMQPVCSPSRAAIVTSKFPYKLGLSHGFIAAGAPYGVPLSERTIAQEVAAHGWIPHMIGKWHLGMVKWAFTPTYRGFATHFGFYNGATHYWAHTHPESSASSPLDLHRGTAANTVATPVADRNGTSSRDVADYAPFLYAEETNKLLDRHVDSADGGAVAPLFLYLTHQSVHEPIDCPRFYEEQFPAVEPDCVEDWTSGGPQQCKRRTFCGMVLALDEAVSNVTSHMGKLGLWENTLFIFTTDNGGNQGAAGNNHPLRGGKYTLFEGGTRATAFLGGGLVPSSLRGTTSKLMMHCVDWMPTILSIVGATPSVKVDGVAQWAALTSGAAAPRTSFIYNIDPCDGHQGDTNTSGIRIGDWKYIKAVTMSPDVWMPSAWVPTNTSGIQPSHNDTRGPWLFNIADDPEERNNLIATHTLQHEQLAAALDKAALETLRPFNCKGSPGSTKQPENVTCPNGVWTPWE